MESLRPSDVGEVGRYRLVARLGSGGMGQVYLGLSPDGRLVALKRVHAILAENADFRSRFRREVNASRMVSGAYTAAVMDADTEAVLPWLASVFVPGPSLDTALDHCRPLPLSSVRVLAAGLAAALSEVHRAGLVHRDLKPSNVLLAEDGPRLIDFGVARAAQASTEITQVGSVIGSPRYMSPEQAEGKSLTSASDVFSLGSILLLACTGKTPFGPGTTPEVLYRVVHSEPDLAAAPAELRELLSACLAKQPDARPTPDAVQAAIGQIDPGQPWLPEAVRVLIDAQWAELRALLPRADIPELDSSEADISETATVASSDTTGSLAPIPSGHEEPEPSPPVSSGVRSRRGRSAKVVRIVVALVSAAALIATGIVWASLHWFQDNTNTTNVIADLGEDPNAPPAADGATDILLVGNDTRTDAKGRPLPLDVLKKLRTEATTDLNTDTIMVLRVPKGGGQAVAMSIPRDTYTSLSGMPGSKINAAYGLAKKRVADRLRAKGDTASDQVERASDEAGRQALVRSVQKLTGLRVDHYAEISLYGFYLLTKAVGGVPVCLNNATTDKDSGADFMAGPQTVSGGDALAFVRQRHNLPDGDLDRIVRQQVFLAAAAKKVLSAGTLTKPGRLRALVDTVSKSLTVDSDLDLLSLVQRAQSLVSGNVRFATIPVTGRNGRSPDGQSIVTVDTQQVRRFVRDTVAHSGGPPEQRHTPSGDQPGAGQPSAAPPPAAPGSLPAPADRDTPRTPTPPVTVDGTRCVD